MLESKNTQFTISPKGEILWQEKVNNPVPGKAVATIIKGEHPLKPDISVIDNETSAKYTDKREELVNTLKMWLSGHIREVLNALVMLEISTGMEEKDDAPSNIALAVYGGLGIIPREGIESFIAELTPETRAALRLKKIRLGPLFAFIPELNKPAAVKLRALLLSVYNGMELPARVPSDGIVSMKLEEENPDKAYFSSIGYPVYGGRAVRIDMLDRVISCVYDHAEKGKFQARHEMAEWLGCSIDGLYSVLESMGHVKIFDPAEQEPKEKVVEGVLSELGSDKFSEEVVVDIPSPVSGEPEGVAPVVEGTIVETDVKQEVKQNEKPELATFRLKKGKAFQASTGDKGARDFSVRKSNNVEEKPKNNDKSFKNKNQKHKKSDTNKKDGKKFNKEDRGPRIITAEAKRSAEDSPFAILQQLKK